MICHTYKSTPKTTLRITGFAYNCSNSHSPVNADRRAKHGLKPIRHKCNNHRKSYSISIYLDSSPHQTINIRLFPPPHQMNPPHVLGGGVQGQTFSLTNAWFACGSIFHPRTARSINDFHWIGPCNLRSFTSYILRSLSVCPFEDSNSISPLRNASSLNIAFIVVK
eukprot:338444_1